MYLGDSYKIGVSIRCTLPEQVTATALLSFTLYFLVDNWLNNEMRSRRQQMAYYDGHGYQMDTKQMYGYRYFRRRCAECHRRRETFGGELVSLINAMQH